jgi:lysine-specific demethylase/histidyl-hydroxylase NO66
VTGLARCVGDVGHFLQTYWGRAPLHRPTAGGAGFADLLSLDDVDTLVTSSFLRVPALRLVRDGTPLDPGTYTRSSRLGGRQLTDVVDAGKAYERFREGSTIVLQGLHRFWPALTGFARDLELELTQPVQVNAYVTPPTARGLAVHYDTHDVFVLQVAGSKRWSVYDPVLANPLPSQPWSSARGDPGEPTLTVCLQEGEVLYVPRGFPHSARAQEGVSAHLTVGVLGPTWVDVLRAAVDGIDDEVELRASLPPGFADDPEALAPAVAERLARLRDWLATVDPGEVAATMARRFWSGRTPILTGQLGLLLRLDEVDDGSSVRRRRGAVCRMHADGDRLHLLLGDRQLHLPAGLEPAVERLLAGDGAGVQVGTLADLVDGPSRLVLVRRLVREGLLELVDG